jgi:hypothetical protein
MKLKIYIYICMFAVLHMALKACCSQPQLVSCRFKSDMDVCVCFSLMLNVPGNLGILLAFHANKLTHSMEENPS